MARKYPQEIFSLDRVTLMDYYITEATSILTSTLAKNPPMMSIGTFPWMIWLDMIYQL